MRQAKWGQWGGSLPKTPEGRGTERRGGQEDGQNEAVCGSFECRIKSALIFQPRECGQAIVRLVRRLKESQPEALGLVQDSEVGEEKERGQPRVSPVRTSGQRQGPRKVCLMHLLCPKSRHSQKHRAATEQLVIKENTHLTEEMIVGEPSRCSGPPTTELE